MRFYFLAATAILLAWSAETRAQNFFGGNNTAFDPEISIVESGVNLDVQATVSHDRKYVTMTMRPQLATLIALREFAFQGPGGVVGQNNPPAQPGQIGNANQANAPRMPALARPAAPKPVLLQEGFFRVDTPEPQPVAAPVPDKATEPATKPAAAHRLSPAPSVPAVVPAAVKPSGASRN